MTGKGCRWNDGLVVEATTTQGMVTVDRRPIDQEALTACLRGPRAKSLGSHWPMIGGTEAAKRTQSEQWQRERRVSLPRSLRTYFIGSSPHRTLLYFRP